MGKLKQNGSAQSYTTAFRNLAEELEWNEASLIDKYKEGLKDNVKQLLLQSTINEDGRQPRDLESWIRLAVRTDDILYASKKMTDSNQESGKGKHRESGKAATTSDKSNDKRVPPEIIKGRMRLNLCIKCGKAGHCIKDCHAKEYSHDKLPVQGKAGEVGEETNEEDDKSTVSEN